MKQRVDAFVDMYNIRPLIPSFDGIRSDKFTYVREASAGVACSIKEGNVRASDEEQAFGTDSHAFFAIRF